MDNCRFRAIGGRCPRHGPRGLLAPVIPGIGPLPGPDLPGAPPRPCRRSGRRLPLSGAALVDQASRCPMPRPAFHAAGGLQAESMP